MKHIFLLFSFTLLIQPLSVEAKNYLDENLKKETWSGIDVVWLEDNSLPTYDISIYFGEGAHKDRKSKNGETELMFDQLTSGTRRYFQKNIVESLEFFGTSYGGNVTHEFSTFNISGLVKDLNPSMKMVCHLFRDATFPKQELEKTKKRKLSGIKSMITNHGTLANRIFRNESLKTTQYSNPVGGTSKTIKSITSLDLMKRLKHFNESVYKKIYVKGPKAIKSLKEIIVNDCAWKGGVKRTELPQTKSFVKMKDTIIFVPVPKSNQAQVRVGRVMTSSEVASAGSERRSFSAKFLGGGFTSRLIQKLRVEKGLTYSAGAYVSEQGSYGRSGVSTFTKNETIVEMLSSIKEVLYNASTNIQKENFSLSRNNIKGNYLLSLESTRDFLQGLIMFDHVKKNYQEIYKFSERIDKVKKEGLEKTIGKFFNWEDQTIVIVGSKKLIKVLKKAGYKIIVKNYKNYL